MIRYIIKRALWMIPTLFVISVISFVIIQLPPGDYMTVVASTYASQGEILDPAALENLRIQYGLGEPIYVQYGKWMWGILSRGNFGYSFQYHVEASSLIWGRLGLTVAISFSSLMVTWLVALPVGIYSAVRQYSIGDYLATLLGFIGLATPNFMLALIMMWVSYRYWGVTLGGLFSMEYVNAPWGAAKLIDMVKHIWVPMVILSMNGTAGLIRVMRANLLDELNRPYVVTARSKGLGNARLLFKYPVRMALNPFVSTVGWQLPQMVSGAMIVSVVLSLPTTGPLLLQSLKAQDMYLAGSFILLLSSLTVIGTLVSDVLLAILDPRIRLE